MYIYSYTLISSAHLGSCTRHAAPHFLCQARLFGSLYNLDISTSWCESGVCDHGLRRLEEGKCWLCLSMAVVVEDDRWCSWLLVLLAWKVVVALEQYSVLLAWKDSSVGESIEVNVDSL